MILYFSATGNGKYIAERIANEFDDQYKSIVDCIEEHEYYFKNEKIFGIVVPTYFWRLPRIVEKYLKELQLENCAYTFFLASYGTTTGQSKAMASKLQNFDAYYSVIMPDTWTPIFDLTNQSRVNKWLRDGNEQLDLVIKNIKAQNKGDFIDKKVPRWIAALPSAYMYNKERRTKYLFVDQNLCVGCGLCEKKCPVNAIKIENGHPVWICEECEMCLGCLHRCPKFAIYYGSEKTKKHGKYINPCV